MIKQLLFSALLLVSGQMAMASQPIRMISVRQADGTLASFPVSTEEDETSYFDRKLTQRSFSAKAFSASTEDGLGKYGVRSKGVLNSIGVHKIPVIMVEFQDVEFQPETTLARVDSLFNKEGYRPYTASRGSVRDYFVQQSYNMFQPNFSVVGKFKAKNNRKYYGETTSYSKNIRAAELYAEITATAAASGVDFSPFLENGSVPLVVIFFAGIGEHNSFEAVSEDCIWAHFMETATQTGAVKFNSYFMGNELMSIYKRDPQGTSYLKDEQGFSVVESTRLDGIGVLCHELSHALGLPDLYNTGAGESLKTPDYHDIMDYGQYISSGFRPAGYSAYQRSMLGWLPIQELKTDAAFVTLEKLSEQSNDVPKAYMLRNPNKPTEYFIFENRQESNWFDSRFGKGMLVSHVNYDASAWDRNVPNTVATNLRYVVVPADNEWQNHKNAGGFSPYQGDFFPGTGNVTEFSSSSAPRMVWSDGSAANTPLYNISETPDGRITFSYLDRTVNAIFAVASSAGKDAIYTLDGRLVHRDDLKAGVYIQGGKKIIVR